MRSKRELIDHAVHARNEQSYAPYSEYPVGAALELENGTIVTAGNIELKPTVVGLHAEQRAVAQAIEKYESEAMRVCIALPNNQPPCGVCLQALASIDPDLDMGVLVFNTDEDELGEWTLEELIPEAYTPDVRHDDL